MNVRSGSPLNVARDTGRRVIAAIAVIAAFSSCNEHTLTATTAPTSPASAVNANGVPFTVEFFLVAHQDDWQLFFGDRVAAAVNSAAKVVLVYSTAGSGADFPPYWQAREQATNASVDTITPAGPWACANATVNSHQIYRCTKANTVSYYLHLPNPGDLRPGGLSSLRDGGISTLTAVDGTATYASWGDLVSTVQSIISTEAGIEPDANVAVHAPESERLGNDGDHSDHLATGDATRAAVVGHDYNRFWYFGYPNQYYPENLTPAQLAVKWATVYAYDKVMMRLMGETIIGTSGAEVWVPRTVYRSEPSSGTPPPPPGPPSAPSALVASSVSGSGVDLVWTDNATNEQGFNVERAADVDGVAGTYSVIASVGVNVHNYSDATLQANVRYWYRVVAYNSTASSSYSNESSAILVAPSAPSGLQGIAISTTRIDLSWTDNSANESGFRVERAVDVGGIAGTYAQIASVGANVSTYSNTGLQAGTQYWYRVIAYNAAGTSAYSAEANAATSAAPTPPNAPSALVATVASGTQINLAWTDNSADESGFRVERAADVGGAAGTYAQIASIAANVTTYSNTGLQAGTRYWYRVVAFSAVGTSAYSTEASATTTAPTAPNAPSALVTTVASGTQINLAWTDNSADELGFRVERAPDVGGVAGTYAQIASVGANVRTYSDATVQINSRFWYRVVGYNAAGSSNYSNESSAMPSTPAAPSGLLATANSGTRIDLSWTDNSADEQGFRIERAPDVGGIAGTYAQIASVGVNVRTYSNTGLQIGTPYWYRVRAYNVVGPSAYSPESSVSTISLPNAPSVLVATTASGTRINLSWTDNSANEQGFRVERAADAGGAPGAFAQITSVGVNAISYGNTGLANGTRYWYRVRSYNQAGTSAYSNITDATTLRPPAPPTTIQAVAASNSIVDVTWTDNADNEASYRLERAPDVAGAPGAFTLVATLGANVNSYRVTGLASGTSYWFRVRAQNTVANSAWAAAVSATTLPPISPSNLAVRAYLVGTQRNAELTWAPGTEARIDVWRAGVKVTSSVANSGGPRNYTSGTSLGLAVAYQVCLVGKTDAASCTLVVFANY